VSIWNRNGRSHWNWVDLSITLGNWNGRAYREITKLFNEKEFTYNRRRFMICVISRKEANRSGCRLNPLTVVWCETNGIVGADLRQSNQSGKDEEMSPSDISQLLVTFRELPRGGERILFFVSISSWDVSRWRLWIVPWCSNPFFNADRTFARNGNARHWAVALKRNKTTVLQRMNFNLLLPIYEAMSKIPKHPVDICAEMEFYGFAFLWSNRSQTVIWCGTILEMIPAQSTDARVKVVCRCLPISPETANGCLKLLKKPFLTNCPNGR
jgi:hypothetical protein